MLDDVQIKCVLMYALRAYKVSLYCFTQSTYGARSIVRAHNLWIVTLMYFE